MPGNSIPHTKRDPPPRRDGSLSGARLLGLELNLDVHARRKIETHKRVDGGAAGVEDIDETLVGEHLKLLAGVLVLVGRADDRVKVALGGQGDGAGNAGAGLLGGVHDELGGLVDDLVIVALGGES